MKAAGWSLVIIGLGVGMAVAADLPRVNVDFVFEASMYLTNEDLGDGGRQSVADAAVRLFISEAKKPTHFPFITWTSGQPGAKHLLTIAVTQRPAGRDQQVDLVFRGSISGNAVNAATVTLYSWTDGKHANDADRLALDVTTAITTHIEDLRSTFAMRVPVATRVELDKDNMRVLVDAPASELKADARVSTLAVSFVGTQSPLQTTMMLKDPSPFGAAQTACKIQQFDFGGLKLDDQHQWSVQLPSIFSPGHTVRVLSVTFDVYKYSDVFVARDDQ